MEASMKKLHTGLLIYKAFHKRQNSEEAKKITGCQEFWKREGEAEYEQHHGVSMVVNILWHCIIGCMRLHICAFMFIEHSNTKTEP